MKGYAVAIRRDDCSSCDGTGSGGLGVGCTDCLGTGRDPRAQDCQSMMPATIYEGWFGNQADAAREGHRNFNGTPRCTSVGGPNCGSDHK